MRILFLGRRYLYFRAFEGVIRELAAHGHQVHLAVERDDIEGRPALIDALTSECGTVTCGYAPSRGDDDWTWVASRLRLGLDYLRYQDPLFDETPKLRDRARERTPGGFVRAGDALRRYGRWARRPLAAFVRQLERVVPDDPAIGAFIEEQRPDVVLLTPLIDLGSSQIDYLRAAHRRGLPTAVCVWSWDHLSSKALIRDCPDRVFVWNDTQRREAMTLHRVPGDRIVVTGAQSFDQWFDRQPSRGRGDFCRAMGLASDRPFILWVCSAPFLGSQPEAPFVIEWIRRLRAGGDPSLRDVPILVRPHPSRTREWDGVDLSALGDVAVYGSSPIDAPSRADYFDALFHSALVAGLNTSAFIEAGIVGRPVHTILLPEWHENQRGTLHFRYLLQVAGGLVQAAEGYDEHFRQLAASLAAAPSGPRPFVREFVRPYGLDVAATPLFVKAVEQMGELRPTARRVARRAPIRRRLLTALVRRRAEAGSERWLYSERELEVIGRNREARARKAGHEAERRAVRDAEKREKQATRDAEWARHRASRAAADAEKKAAKAR